MLLKKARRSMQRSKRAYFACVFLIAVAVMLYTALHIAVKGLEASVTRFYSNNRIADVYAQVTAMPEGYADTLAGLDGISDVQPRYVMDVRAGVSGSEEIITLRLVSVPAGPQEQINALYVTGRPPEQAGDILVNTAFWRAHGLSCGDFLSVFTGGREYIYSVGGTAMSPEHVYITKDAYAVLPDESGFGVGYLTEEGMSLLTGRRGVANSVLFRLEKGYTFDDVKPALEDSLSRFGLIGLTDKKDQSSYALLEMELDSIRSISTLLPMLFLLLAVVVLYLMLRRTIEQERTQIGMLKALGYSNRRLIGHYMLYGGVTGSAGGLLGWLLGYLMSGGYLTMLLQFFTLPQYEVDFDPLFAARAVLLAVGSGLFGAFAGARRVTHLQPAEAMRPESPRAVRYDITGKARILSHILNARGRMALRGIARNPVRSGVVVVSVMFSFGLLSFMGSIDGIMDKMIYSQFEDIQRYEVKLTLERPVSYTRAVEDAYALEYVTRAEGLFELPAQLRSGHIKRGVVLTGIAADAVLYHIADTNTKERFSPPGAGVILSNGIADRLHVRAGDTVYVDSPLLSREVAVPVSRVIEQNLGSGCYMELSFMSALFNKPETATAVLLDTSDLSQLKETLKSGGNIAAFDDKDSTLQKYKDMMGMFSSLYLTIEIVGTLVAFAILYNVSAISLAERRREYATLRVLGLTVAEMSEIINLEYGVLGAFGMLLGIPFTNLMNRSMNLMLDTSLFSMPSTLPVSAYLTGFVCCAAALALSAVSARRKVRTFDMVEALKERE